VDSKLNDSSRGPQGPQMKYFDMGGLEIFKEHVRTHIQGLTKTQIRRLPSLLNDEYNNLRITTS
jgi:hypothetical protein